VESNLKGIESILNPASNTFNKGDYELAIEEFTIGLKQYPDNIQMLIGLIDSCKALGNNTKVAFCACGPTWASRYRFTHRDKLLAHPGIKIKKEIHSYLLFFFSGPTWARTRDPLIMSQHYFIFLYLSLILSVL
jgi:hypothetical protein